MGKMKSPPDKAEELREATRAANEVLGDLSRLARDVEKLIDTGFEARVSASVKKAHAAVHSMLEEFKNSVRRHSDGYQKAITNRWAYIESMCLTSGHIANLIAMHVLKDAGGTVDVEDGKWHLVREKTDEDGALFAFPKGMSWRAEHDPKVQEAIRKAVNEYRPDIDLLQWSKSEAKGTDEK